MKEVSRKRTARLVHRLAAAVALLMMLASSIGLGVEGIYRDNALVAAGWLGNDAITLLLGAPLLAAAARVSAQGSRRAWLVLLGMLLYAFYNYAFYLFGAAFNALFLAYVAIVTLSGIGLLLGLFVTDPSQRASAIRSGAAPSGATAGALQQSGDRVMGGRAMEGRVMVARVVAAFMVSVGALLGVFWTGLSVAYFFTGEPPAMVSATDHPTNVTGALDLALVVPLGVVAGIWLWHRRPWGHVLAVLWNVKGAVYMLALSGATVSAYLAGASESLIQLWLWGAIGAGCILATVALLRAEGR